MQQIPGCFVPMHTCIDNQIHAFCRNTTKTGVFNFLNKRATEIAVKTVKKWLLNRSNSMERIIFDVFKNEEKKILCNNYCAKKDEYKKMIRKALIETRTFGRSRLKGKGTTEEQFEILKMKFIMQRLS